MLAAPSPSTIAIKSEHQHLRLQSFEHLTPATADRLTPSNSYQFNAPSHLNFTPHDFPPHSNQSFKSQSQPFRHRLIDQHSMDSKSQTVPPPPLSAPVPSFKSPSVSPPPCTSNQSNTYSHQHGTYYNHHYSNSTCPSSSRSSPGASSTFVTHNALSSGSGYLLHSSLSDRGLHPRDAAAGDDDLPASKRLRSSASFSHLDARTFEKPAHLVLASSNHTTSNNNDLHTRAVVVTKLEADVDHALPPIVTREERAHATTHHQDHKPIFNRTAIEENHHASDSTPDSDEAHENSSSSYKPTDTNSNPSTQLDRQFSHSPSVPHNQLVPQAVSGSDPSSFVHHQQHQNVSAAPHSANPISLSNLQQQDSHFGHSSGYYSALPSPVPSKTDQHTLHSLQHRGSYPSSPTTAMTAPSSATFSTASNTTLVPLSPPSARTSQAPPSPGYRNSASAFPHHAAAHLVGSSYPTSGAAQGVHVNLSNNRSISSHQSPLPSPALSANGDGQWSNADGQPTRRRGKLPTAVTITLRTWLMAHTTHPYPTEEEKKSLCEQTQLTMNQVSNWFINARRRILVPPTGCNAIHEVRQPVRRQAQSQLARGPTGASHAVSASPSSASPTFPASAFNFRYPHISACRSASGPSHRPPSSPINEHYASYAYSVGTASAPTTPQFATTPYPSYPSFYPPPQGPFHHFAPATRLPSPRSQPNTPGYPPPQIAYHHSIENHEAFNRHPSNHHPARPNSVDTTDTFLKRDWHHPQSQPSGPATEMGN